eukprot:46919-Eustigmatos_ZCMA.PRE.1
MLRLEDRVTESRGLRQSKPVFYILGDTGLQTAVIDGLADTSMETYIAQDQPSLHPPYLLWVTMCQL